MTDDAKLRALKVFLRAYAILSLILFGGLMIGFVARAPILDPGGAWHVLIWDRVTDPIPPMLFAVYIVWSIFIYRAARDPLAHKMFLDFTAWANLAHGIAMVPHALLMPEYHIKVLTDIPWVVLPAIAIAFLRPRGSEVASPGTAS